MGQVTVGSREFNALLFAFMVLAYWVALYDASSWVWAPLLGPLAIYALRIGFPALPAWFALLATTGVVFGINVELNAEGGFFMCCVGAFVLSAERDDWLPDRIVLGLTAIAPFGARLIDTDAVQNWNWPFWSLGIVISGAFGMVLFRQTRIADELTEANALLTEQAASEERRRIAREVHDLVGHSLTVVLLHVTGARRLVHRDPDEAEVALEQAERSGRQALADIRRTVSLLREQADGTAPTPTLVDIAALIADSAAAGIVITHDLTGPLAMVDDALGLTVYRIVQESLANVGRHAPGAAAHVVVEVGPTDVVVEITNTGGANAPAATTRGNGLIGMQERAAAAGGTLVAGPDGRGWRVRSTLPRSVTTAGALG